ncbi:MAG: helix-turn-helix domain-containing protein [Candidatus Woesearchaeota archaeon]
MDASILEDLGLSHTEIRTYLALLELGQATSGALIEKSRLPNSSLHLCLNSLIEKGLISFISEGKRRIYQATNPDNIVQYIDEKKQRLLELLPELKKKQVNVKESATLYKGVRGINEAYNILISTHGKEFNTFGGGDEVTDRMGLHWWLNMHQRRISRKLPSRQVFDEKVRPRVGAVLKLPLTRVRFLPAEFAQIQVTAIVGDTVVISVFTQNCYALVIKDAEIAKGYTQYFEVLWNMAKK